MHRVPLYPKHAALCGWRAMAGLLLGAALVVLSGCSGGGNNPPPPPGDTQPPTAPANLTATAKGSSEIDLGWSASTDNVGVTGYRVERCQSAGCSNFAQIATPTGTTFNDTGLAPSTSFSYRVRATDAASNLSGFSNAASGTTGASPISVAISPKRAALTTSQTQQFTASVTGTTNQGVNWFVDGAQGGNATAGTITASGLYTPGTQAGRHNVTAHSVVDGTSSPASSVAVTDLAGVFTWHNDNTRAGVNSKEYALDASTVSANTFGKLFSCPVDGFVYAQPLYVANVSIAGQGKHNVVYVATENDSIYAFDADSTPCSTIWSISLLPTGEAHVSGAEVSSSNIGPLVGITGTPVIDPTTNTLYAVAESVNRNTNPVTYIQRLHAIDITTGAKKSSVVITATFPGTGDGSVLGSIGFDPLRENQRPALLLTGGVVYIAWASHDDRDPYHGWVIGYNASTLQQTAVLNVTPNGGRGGIWLSGGGPAADSIGNVYVSVGNGTFDPSATVPPVAPNNDFGESIVKLNSSLALTDFYTPSNQGTLTALDLDFGAGPVLFDSGGSAFLLTVGKDGNIYLLNRNQLGHFNGTTDTAYQNFNVSLVGLEGFRNTPAFFNNTAYIAGEDSPLFRIPFDTTTKKLATPPYSGTNASSVPAVGYGGYGTTPSVSAQGTSNGIVWTIDVGPAAGAPAVDAILRAYDAADLTKLLYSSGAKAGDAAGTAVKFTVPTVANGKVYVGTQSELDIYGLLPN